MKKVIRIKTGVFLSKAHDDRIETVDTIQKALDVSDWNFDKVAHIISNLHKVGYQPQVLEYKEEK